MTLVRPDRDDITAFTVTRTNRANVRDLKEGNKLVAGAALTNVSIIWADNTTYRAQHLGDFEIVFDTSIIGRGVGLLGPLAYAVSGTPALAYWMSGTAFHMSDGTGVMLIPNQEDVRQWVYRQMDARYATKFNAFYNPITNSVQFNFVSVDSLDRECDRYVIVCLDDFSWVPGTMTRTGYTVIPQGLSDIVAFGADRYLYTHETGYNDDGAGMDWFIRSGMLDIGEGDVDMDVDRFINDVDRQLGTYTIEINLYERPNSQSPIATDVSPIEEGSEGEDLHMGGRYGTLEFSGSAINTDWRLGTPLLTLKPAGQR
jgi:hypothetical protein